LPGGPPYISEDAFFEVVFGIVKSPAVMTETIKMQGFLRFGNLNGVFLDCTSLVCIYICIQT
jgi:hypothetical protein